ncbi:hypothetical protein BC834DRAFT_896203 [Gloeopeniophorella convolvens]|nr:hypothetical protein BC834DRAFT_896203 [Gloeopeniophorella convolvens]
MTALPPNVPFKLYASLEPNAKGQVEPFLWELIMSQDTKIGFHLAVRAKEHSPKTSHGPAEWIDHEGYSNIESLRRTCLLVELGTLPLGIRGDYLKTIVGRIPHVIPPRYHPVEQVFTSRVWFKEAISILQAGGVITCPNVELLEQELLDMAHRAKEARTNTAQYAVRVSQCCF